MIIGQIGKKNLCKCDYCGKEFTAIKSHSKGKFCSYPCFRVYYDTHKEQIHTRYNGYKYRFVNGKRVFEHVLVMEKHIGRKLNANEVVHHIDHDRGNNDISNLQLMTKSEHSRLHRKQELKDGKQLFGDLHERLKKRVIGTNSMGETLIFDSLSDARKAGFIHVWDCCNGRYKTSKGYAWRYADD